MTGTACDSYEYKKNQTRYLNPFDIFSLRLFEKIKTNHLPAKEKSGCESNANQMIVDGSVDIGDG